MRTYKYILLTFFFLCSTAAPFLVIAEKTESKGSFAQLQDDEELKDAPLTIRSDSLDFDAKARVFVYKDNVEIKKGALLITAKLVTGTYGEDNKLLTIVCENDVVITKGEEMKATANRAIYKVPEGIVELTEGPELQNGANALTADKIKLFIEEDRSEASGDVRVKVIKSQAPLNAGSK